MLPSAVIVGRPLKTHSKVTNGSKMIPDWTAEASRRAVTRLGIGCADDFGGSNKLTEALGFQSQRSVGLSSLAVAGGLRSGQPNAPAPPKRANLTLCPSSPRYAQCARHSDQSASIAAP
jgi:hypothetical protein